MLVIDEFKNLFSGFFCICSYFSFKIDFRFSVVIFSGYLNIFSKDLEELF